MKKIKIKKIALLVSIVFSNGVLANPTGGLITSGSAQINNNGNVLNINQSTSTLGVNWQTFNINSKETVNFIQPNQNSIAINNILDPNGSLIMGNLNANGKVFLINPNGIIFGKGAEVDVGGLVASGLSLSQTGEKYSFSGKIGNISNAGNIVATDGGYIILLGGQVSNVGQLKANSGDVIMASGGVGEINFLNGNLVGIQVTKGVLNSLVENGGAIVSEQGKILLTAGAVGDLLKNTINNTGVLEAKTVSNQNGVIKLIGNGANSVVNVGGIINASAPDGGNGGRVETSASKVIVASNTKVDTLADDEVIVDKSGKSLSKYQNGTWVIDPTDYTVAASGGDITGATLSSNLNTTNVTLQSSAGGSGSSGNVNINDPVSWSANTTLSLVASNNVNVNSNIVATGNTAGLVISPNTANGTETASGTGIFNLKMGAYDSSGNLLSTANSASITLSGATPSLNISGKPYVVINSLGNPVDVTTAPATPTLQGMANSANLATNFALGSDINAGPTLGWNSGAGFTPIGNATTGFSGNFDGLGHKITGLTVNQPANADLGLFGLTVNGTIQNVNMVMPNISGNYNVGGLAGATNGGTFNNIIVGTPIVESSSSYIFGSDYISNAGGMIGITSSVSLNNSYVTAANMYGNGDNIGGVIGNAIWAGKVTNSYSLNPTVIVFGTPPAFGGVHNIGGFSGTSEIDNTNIFVQGANIVEDSTSSSVVGAVGGVFGYEFSGMDNNIRLVGNNTIAGGLNVGGITGQGDFDGLTMGTVSSGTTVTAYTQAGGLVGGVFTGTSFNIKDSYSQAKVVANGGGAAGGLVGYGMFGNSNNNAISDSFATGTVVSSGSGQGVGGLVGFQDSGGIQNSYATGAVTSGGPGVGGLVGLNYTSINNSYSSGSVTSTSGTNIGGLAGYSSNPLLVTGSFWDVNTSGRSSSSGGVGMTTANMLNSANFTTATTANGNVNPAWDYVNTWIQYNGNTYPLLRPFMTGLTVTASNETKTYDGNPYTGSNSSTYSITPGANLFGSLVYNDPGINVGSYAITQSGLWSNQFGYIINYVNGTLTINPAPITVVTVNGTSVANKTYDGTNIASLTGGALIGVHSGDNVTLNQSGFFVSKNVGNNIAVVATDTLGGTSASNYSLVEPTGLTGNILAKQISISGTVVATKTYDGTTSATLSGGRLVGVVSGDNLVLNQSGNFTNKNAGNNVAVNVTDILAGTSASNYSLVEPSGVTGNILPKTINAVATGANKTYDGTTNDNVSLALLGVVSGDNVLVNDISANFADKNVGNNKIVTVSGISLSGSDQSNYSIGSNQITTQVNITPATLFYNANNATVYTGTNFGNLSGTITGFVVGDNIANSTTGVTAWSTPATTNSTPGKYAINGGGLNSQNYVFEQNPSNNTALMLDPGVVVKAVGNAINSADYVVSTSSPSPILITNNYIQPAIDVITITDSNNPNLPISTTINNPIVFNNFVSVDVNNIDNKKNNNGQNNVNIINNQGSDSQIILGQGVFKLISYGPRMPYNY